MHQPVAVHRLIAEQQQDGGADVAALGPTATPAVAAFPATPCAPLSAPAFASLVTQRTPLVTAPAVVQITCFAWELATSRVDPLRIAAASRATPAGAVGGKIF
ncbi:hypothetical protein [Nakamurella sp. PAMC28650]|uniref:hypothetical protein n=1 Tax=Nakamurella sp. PAMC28650 TaxID=2762325 RepID=UPI001C9B806C|nr:hypothetical protein [Nakamurella sp. PAMC28650]